MTPNQTWYEKMGWTLPPTLIHPFDFEKIVIDVSVGYEEERKKIFDYIKYGTGIMVLSSPPGYGKTHLLAWLEKKLQDDDKVFPIIYYTPPENIQELVKGFSTQLYISGLLEVPVFQKISNLFGGLDNYLSRITKADLPKLVSNQDKTILILCDEAQNADPRILSEFKVMRDHPESGDKVRIILAGYKTEKVDLFKKLESTIQDRVSPSNKIYLSGISKAEAEQLIKGRLQMVSAKDQTWFDPYLERIYKFSQGRPRELLKICKELVDYCAMNNLDSLSYNMITIILNKFIDSKQKLDVPLSSKEKETLDMSILSENMFTIIRTLADYPGSTKEEIAKRTNLSPETVNTLLWRMTKDRGYLTRFSKAGFPLPMVDIDNLKTTKRGRSPSVYSLSEKMAIHFAKT